jgi:hypothetical protein
MQKINFKNKYKKYKKKYLYLAKTLNLKGGNNEPNFNQTTYNKLCNKINDTESNIHKLVHEHLKNELEIKYNKKIDLIYVNCHYLCGINIYNFIILFGDGCHINIFTFHNENTTTPYRFISDNSITLFNKINCGDYDAYYMEYDKDYNKMYSDIKSRFGILYGDKIPKNILVYNNIIEKNNNEIIKDIQNGTIKTMIIGANNGDESDIYRFKNIYDITLGLDKNNIIFNSNNFRTFYCDIYYLLLANYLNFTNKFDIITIDISTLKFFVKDNFNIFLFIILISMLKKNGKLIIPIEIDILYYVDDNSFEFIKTINKYIYNDMSNPVEMQLKSDSKLIFYSILPTSHISHREIFLDNKRKEKIFIFKNIINYAMDNYNYSVDIFEGKNPKKEINKYFGDISKKVMNEYKYNTIDYVTITRNT